MTTIEEFQQKVKEIRGEIDFENSSPQKLRTLLQAIKDYCAHTLEDPTVKNTPLEKEVMSTIFQTEKDLARVKAMSIPGMPVGGLPPLMPTIQPMQAQPNPKFGSSNLGATAGVGNKLDSVPVGAFDPNSSPILRKLREKTTLSQPTQMHKEYEIKPIEEKKLEPVPFNTTPFPNLAPFPNTTPSPSPEKPKLMPAFLEIPQLDLKITLKFQNSIEQIGQEDFTAKQLNLSVPEQFFSAILHKTSDGSISPSEHFVIEQPTYGKFFVKDRANAQKTYFRQTFIDANGADINDNDTFILPVMINDQLASLTVIFHCGDK
jgi:hypothetical protein